MHADQKAVYGEIHPGKWWLSRNVGNQHSSATSEICQEKKANLNKASLKDNPSFFPVLPEKKEKKNRKEKKTLSPPEVWLLWEKDHLLVIIRKPLWKWNLWPY